jgi:pyruvate/2-oxoglutarate dehydrogenase complex dihydrolipoamide acyltransferase (E2) component
VASSLAEIRVPDIGNYKGVEVIDVLVKPGDAIELDAPLITLETEKATMDVPATAAGTVREVKLQRGSRVSQGDVIALVEATSSTSPASAGEGVKPSPQPSPAPAGEGAKPTSPATAGEVTRSAGEGKPQKPSPQPSPAPAGERAKPSPNPLPLAREREQSLPPVQVRSTSPAFRARTRVPRFVSSHASSVSTWPASPARGRKSASRRTTSRRGSSARSPRYPQAAAVRRCPRSRPLTSARSARSSASRCRGFRRSRDRACMRAGSTFRT